MDWSARKRGRRRLWSRPGHPGSGLQLSAVISARRNQAMWVLLVQRSELAQRFHRPGLQRDVRSQSGQRQPDRFYRPRFNPAGLKAFAHRRDPRIEIFRCLLGLIPGPAEPIDVRGLVLAVEGPCRFLAGDEPVQYVLDVGPRLVEGVADN